MTGSGTTNGLEEIARRVAARSTELLVLPAIAQVNARAVIRWAWHQAQAAEGVLVELKAEHGLAHEVLDEMAQEARGGWLALLSAERPQAGTIRRLVDRRCAVVWVDPSDPLPTTAGQAQRLRAWDAVHLVASDPSLAPARKALMAHGVTGGVVQLVGPSATGKRSLVEWLALQSASPAMLECVGREAHDAPPTRHSWAFFENLPTLGAERIHWLADRLTPRTTRSGAPLGLGTGTAHRPPGFDEILGASHALLEVLCDAARLAKTAHPTLLLGETGTGKEGLARALHRASGRAGPFVAVDLGALSEQLAESDLFGHSRGAFTGADRARLGAFRAAEGGTLFLDEVANLPPRLQTTLLRILQEKAVRPVGEDRDVPIDVRIISATNADLSAMVARGTFREDLLRRLEVLTLRLPPLRRREDDVVLLAEAFLRREGRRPASHTMLTEAAREALRRHSWPGNVRELQAVMVRAALRAAPERPVDIEDLSELGASALPAAPTFCTVDGGPGEQTAQADLPRAISARLKANTITVPALSQRSPTDLRTLLLTVAGGRPMRAGALDMLVRHPWWGNLAEAHMVMDAAERCGGGLIDEVAVGQVLGTSNAEDPSGIDVLMFACATAEGGVAGVRFHFDADGLVLGRAPDRSAVDQLVAEDRSRATWLSARLPPGPLQVVQVAVDPRMSRVAALIRRQDGMLDVHVPPWSSGDVLVGPLEGRLLAPRPAEPGRSVAPGSGAEIIFVSDNARVARVFVFAGSAASARLAPQVRARLADSQPVTVHTPSPGQGEPNPHGRRWVLSPREREALTDLLVRYPGGEFKGWALQGAKAMADQPSLHHLAGYLDHAPNVAEYVTRLVALEGNEATRDEVLAWWANRPGYAVWLQRLPKRLGLWVSGG